MTVSVKVAAGKKKIYHSLDGLRAIAALCVVFYHFQSFLAPITVSSAYLAVDLFFLLSGFVIANAYHDRLGQSIGPGQFFVLRVIRLYPLYLAGTLILLVSIALGLLSHRAHNWTWGALAGAAPFALLMLPGPHPGSSGLYINFPAWSLFSEIVTNVAYGSTARVRRGWLLRAVVVGAGALLVAAIVIHGSADGGESWDTWWFGPVRAFFSFFVGVIFYKLLEAGRLPVVKVPLLPLFAVVAVVLYVAPPTPWRALYDLGAILLLFPVLVWLCIVNEPRHGLRAYAVAGLISYPIYAIHAPFASALDAGIRRAFGGHVASWSPWIGLGMVAVLIALSWLLAETYDIWARRRLTAIVRSVFPLPR